MSLGLLFWILFLVSLILWGGMWYQPANPYYGRFHPVVILILLALLGWATFGPMVHG